MSKTSVARYVQDLISKGDVVEKDRSKLEEILGDIAKKIDNDKIEDFFIGLDMEKVNNPDLFNSSKGLNLQEITVVAQSITNKIQINEVKERESRSRQEKVAVQTVAKTIMDTTKENEPIEIIVKKVIEIYPGLSPKVAEKIGKDIEQARKDSAEIEDMRKDPENANLSDKELIEKKFKGDSLDVARYASATSIDIKCQITNEFLKNPKDINLGEIGKNFNQLNMLGSMCSDSVYESIGTNKKQVQRDLDFCQKMYVTLGRSKKDSKLINIFKKKVEDITDTIAYGSTLTQINEITKRMSQVRSYQVVLGETLEREKELKELQERLEAQQELAKEQKAKIEQKKVANQKKSDKSILQNGNNLDKTNIVIDGYNNTRDKAFEIAGIGESKEKTSSTAKMVTFRKLLARKKVTLKETQSELFGLRKIFSRDKKKEEKKVVSESMDESETEEIQDKKDEKPVVPDDSGR